MQSCILPFEIVEVIIDLLDMDSLKATSLVCLSVLPRCRKYLFSSIKIDLKNNTEKCETLLSRQTDIPKYVQRLEYILSHDYRHYHPAMLLLERIPCLQSLILRRYYNTRAKFDWIQMVDSSLRSALLNLMRLPTLTHLYLSNISNFLASDLSSSTSLIRLHLHDIEFNNEPLLAFKSDISTMPRIQEFTFKGYANNTIMKSSMAKSAEGIWVALDLTKIKTLSIAFPPIDIEVTRIFLKGFKQLKELRLDVLYYQFDSLAHLGFHTFGTSLFLSLGYQGYQPPYDIFMTSLCDELAAMENNTLQTLMFELYMDPGVLKIPNSVLEMLDAVLSRPNWSCLENISFVIITICPVTEAEQKLANDLSNTKLPRLSRRKSLKFSARSICSRCNP